jgi:2-polyprenyl-3-methyl-5-hydroxy-6-metoxy-1,4-benzoquinol methylase
VQLDSQSWNEWIYSSVYTPESQILNPKNKYGRELLALRIQLLEKYLSGTAVDMGCGIGEFTRIASSFAKTVIGIDYSEQYIKQAREIINSNSGKIEYRLESISQTSIAFNSVSSLFSYSTLYYIPDIEKTIRHFREILIPGGVAILDFGNSSSLMDMFYRQAQENSTAQNFNIPTERIRSILKNLDFEVLEWRSFQLLPMQGLSRRFIYLWPLTTQWWQNVMQCKVKGKLLDEIVSSSFLRNFAYRHLVVVRRND